jgi:hypothetical protein
VLSGCWGSPNSGPVWSECDVRLHIPRDTYDAKKPESVEPYLDACTRALRDAGYTVVRDNSEAIFASKGEELVLYQGKLPRTVHVSAHSVPANLDISITAKTKRYPVSYERRWIEAQRDAMIEMRQLVRQLADLVDLRYPSPAAGD